MEIMPMPSQHGPIHGIIIICITTTITIHGDGIFPLAGDGDMVGDMVGGVAAGATPIMDIVIHGTHTTIATVTADIIPVTVEVE